MRVLLERCAATSLNSKLVAAHKDFFSKMVVDAVMLLDDLLPLNMIGMKKVKGGALEDSRLISVWPLRRRFPMLDLKCNPKSTRIPRLQC